MKKIALAAVACAALLAGCGAGAAVPLVASVEAEALAAMGVDAHDLAASVSASPTPDKLKDRWEKRREQKVLLHRNVLHGEAVVQTKEGPVTVMVQRGEVTAIAKDSVTVRSTDGFTLTWAFHPELRVVEKRASVQPSEIKTGATIALAGPKDGDRTQARLIVLPLKK